MEFLRVRLKVCDAVPKDAISHLGFKVEDGVVRHLVMTPRGPVVVSKRCEDCVFYKLASSTYVFGAPSIHKGVVKLVVADTRVVRKILHEHRGQVVSVERLKHTSIVITEKQREVLSAMANGGSIAVVARMSSRSKVAVYKLFKKTLKKIAELV
ncbi:MAG: bacteriocin [Thermoproteus sp.]